ncbi:MAG: Arm DNA-binding domain-containing protein [Hyphomicrobiales bacterium]|nr:Arm DNA-binding domain-containing protein [Hyphomicrobiales bacterium]
MAKIVQRIVDRDGNSLDDPHTFKSGFSTKQEAEQWLDDYLTANICFP